MFGKRRRSSRSYVRRRPKRVNRNHVSSAKRAELARKDAGNVVGTFMSCCACCVGIWMISIGVGLGPQCKMRCIDPSSWGDESARGNLPKWFVYTGGVITTAGYFACCTVGPLPMGLRAYSPLIGGSIADVMSGLFGKLALFVLFGVISLCNLIGCFWLYMAALSRTPDNSAEEGDPNYCHPMLWNSAYIITNGFWIMTIATAISIGAAIHKFFRGDDAVCEVKTIEGKGKGGKGGSSIRLPRRRRGRGRGRRRGVF